MLASILTGALEVAGVMAASVTFFAGAGGAAALLAGRSGADVGAEAAKGAAAGFIVGIPLSIAAALLLALTS